MPQLWLTYDELAEHMACPPEAARQAAIALAWTRKHSRDGHTRVLMPADLMVSYFAAQAFAPPSMQDRAPFAKVQLRNVLGRAPSAPRQ